MNDRTATRALPLNAYRAAIDLDQPFHPTGDPAPADRLDPLTRTALRLLADDPAAVRLGLRADHPARLDAKHARRLLRAVLTVREPGALPAETAAAVDALLGGERLLRPAVDPRLLPTIAETSPGTAYPAAGRTALWRGDITALAADVIVNAANSALLGCFRPEHPCVDNAIHSAAGPRLRDDCHTVIGAQGAPEPTGTAKLTRAYHLPARFVLHTVGPIVDAAVHPDHEQALVRAYRSCLDVAAEVAGIRTVAFCGISTGVFGYPKTSAALVALDTVAGWIEEHPDRFDRIVFDVFADDDHDHYRQALTDWSTAP